jgi:hypothetical protein
MLFLRSVCVAATAASKTAAPLAPGEEITEKSSVEGPVALLTSTEDEEEDDAWGAGAEGSLG